MEPSSERPFEERLNRLEQRLERMEECRAVSAVHLHPAWGAVLSLAGVAAGFLGLGLPQHYYQFLFAALLLLLAYHRRFLVLPGGFWRWPQAVMNFLLLALLLKLLIGGGVAHPFDWFKVPAVTKAPPAADPAWYKQLVPDFSVQWQPVPAVSGWSIDLTKIQTLLLIATLAGALFRFQPFTSLTALALLAVSIPAYLVFTWDWVILFLVIGSVAIYVQSSVKVPRDAGR